MHRYFFERESKWFGGRLEAPTSPGAKLVGSDDSTAIILDGLSSEEFAKFLWVFYNKCVCPSLVSSCEIVRADGELGRTYSLYEAPVEDWEVILTLSNRWSFPGVKDLAIRELEKMAMSPVKRIKLYTENHVDRNYLIPCYAELCEREEPLTTDEGVDLGIADVIRIAAAREQARSSYLPSGARSPLSPTIHGTHLHQVIRDVFHIAPVETGFGSTADETTHITGALVLISQLKSFLCSSNRFFFSFILLGDPNHTTTDWQNTTVTETEIGDQKTYGNDHSAITGNGDYSKTSDSNANSSQNNSSTPTTGKGNNNADDTNAGTTKGGKGSNTKPKHKLKHNQ